MPYQTNIEEPIPDFRAALESMKTVEIDQELVKQLRDNIILIEDLTPEQAREQRINLCLGMASRNSGITREHIEKMIDEGRF